MSDCAWLLLVSQFLECLPLFYLWNHLLNPLQPLRSHLCWEKLETSVNRTGSDRSWWYCRQLAVNWPYRPKQKKTKKPPQLASHRKQQAHDVCCANTGKKITKAGQVTRFLQSMSSFREWFDIVGLFLAPNGDRIIINRPLVWSKLTVCIVLFCFFRRNASFSCQLSHVTPVALFLAKQSKCVSIKNKHVKLTGHN